MYSKITMGVIAISLSIIALKNLDIVGNANAVVQNQPFITKSEAMIGEIRMFAGDFAPEGWMFCDGRTLEIEGNEDLYSILGFNFGGSQKHKTFDLPNFNGKVAVGVGKDQLIDYVKLGEEKNLLFNLNDKKKGTSFGNPAETTKTQPMSINRPQLNAKTKTLNSNTKPKPVVNSGSLAVRHIICVKGVLHKEEK